MMVKIPATVDRNGMPIGKILEAIRKLGSRRHPHVSDEDRNDGNISLQCGLNLDPDGIGLVVDPGTLTLGPTEPFRTHDHQQNIGRLERFGNLHPEINARTNIIDVPEARVPSELLTQPVEDPPGDVLRIRTAVGNDDLGQGS